VSILRRHRRGRLDISRAVSFGSGERRGGGLIIRELGNSQPSWWPKVKYHPMSLPPTLSQVWIFRVGHHALDGTSEIKRPREMSIVMASLPADTKMALRKVFAAFPPGKPIMDELKVPRDRFVSNRSLMR
jgi:hypothetical protein